jgi:hypothetical protein
MRKPLFLANSNSFYKKLKSSFPSNTRNYATKNWLSKKTENNVQMCCQKPGIGRRRDEAGSKAL